MNIINSVSTYIGDRELYNCSVGKNERYKNMYYIILEKRYEDKNINKLEEILEEMYNMLYREQIMIPKLRSPELCIEIRKLNILSTIYLEYPICLENLRILKIYNTGVIKEDAFSKFNIEELEIITENLEDNNIKPITIVEERAFCNCDKLKRINLGNVMLSNDSFKNVFPINCLIQTDTFNMRAFYTTLQRESHNQCINLKAIVNNMLQINVPAYTVNYLIEIPLNQQLFIFEYHDTCHTINNINDVTIKELYDMFRTFNPLFTIYSDFINILKPIDEIKIKSTTDETKIIYDNDKEIDVSKMFQKIEDEISKKYNINYFNKIETYNTESKFMHNRIWNRMNGIEEKQSFKGNKIMLEITKTDCLRISIKRNFERIFDITDNIEIEDSEIFGENQEI